LKQKEAGLSQAEAYLKNLWDANAIGYVCDAAFKSLPFHHGEISKPPCHKQVTGRFYFDCAFYRYLAFSSCFAMKVFFSAIQVV